MRKHPVAHVSSPSLLSLLILNQQGLILHCHVCSCPLERPLVVICTCLCVFPREMQRSVEGGWETVHLLLLQRSQRFTSLTLWVKNLHVLSDETSDMRAVCAFCVIMAVEEPNNWCQSENSLTHWKFPLQIIKPSGGLAGECVFIDRRVLTVLLGRSVLTHQSSILPAMFCFLPSDLWPHKSEWAGIPMVTLAKWLIVRLKALPLHSLSELFVIQPVSLKGSRQYK